MKVNELIGIYNCNVGDTIAIYFKGEKVYEDWATNYEIKIPPYGNKEVRNFWFKGRKLKIAIW